MRKTIIDARHSMKLLLPMVWNASGGAGHGLVRWVPTRRRQLVRTVDERLRSKIVEPRFAWFEARDDSVFRSVKMLSRVLTRRAVATSDMPACRATAKVQPPAAGFEALDAASPAGFCAGDDFFVMLCHFIDPPIRLLELGITLGLYLQKIKKAAPEAAAFELA